MALVSDKWVRTFDILETDKHNKGFTIYKIESIVYLKSCPDSFTKVTVWKRYNDFKKLHNELRNKHKILRINDTFPNLPQTSYFKRFDVDVINQRKQNILSFLQYVASHGSLFTSNEFVKFFETSYSPPNALNSNINIIRAQLNLPNDPEVTHSPNSDEDQKSDSDSLSVFSGTSSASTSQINLDETQAQDKKSCFSNGHLNQIVESVDSEILPCETVINNLPSDTYLTPPETPNTSTEEHKNNLPQYLIIAKSYISKATELEIEKKYEESFAEYKNSIAILLDGVKDDSDITRRKNVKYQIKKYILRAEKIYNLHLSPESNRLKQICKTNSNISFNIKGALEDLSNYKVLKVLETGMVVLHQKEHNVFYLKVIQKTPQMPKSMHLTIPKDVPYMVKLFQYYDSPNSIFFITQYISKGKLFDEIEQKSAQRKLYSSIIFEKEDNITNSTFEDNNSGNSEYSYLELITDYKSKRGLERRNEINEKNNDAESSSTSNENLENKEASTSSSSTFQKSISERPIKENLFSINYIPPLDTIVKWAAQLFLAVDRLHKVGIVIFNLSPKRLLLDDNDNLKLTFVSNIRERKNLFSKRNYYYAPEVFSLDKVTFAADWWSYGVILFELLTGMELRFVHPEGIFNYTILKIPNYVSLEGKLLLRQLIKYEPVERLGCGKSGVDEIIYHPFFKTVDWKHLRVDAFRNA